MTFFGNGTENRIWGVRRALQNLAPQRGQKMHKSHRPEHFKWYVLRCIGRERYGPDWHGRRSTAKQTSNSTTLT